jgi:hypothetical protein
MHTTGGGANNEDRYDGQPTTQVTNHYIQVLDGAGVDQVLRDHSEQIESSLARVRSSHLTSAAVV